MKTVGDYPMEHSCSDTARMFQKFQDQRQKMMVEVKINEKVSKDLVAYSKQKFECAIEEKQRVRFSSPKQEIHFLDDPLQEHEQEYSNAARESQGKSLGFVQHPVSRPGSWHGPDKILNHCRATCTGSNRICNHIKQISPNYRVVCMSPPSVCELWADSNDYVAADTNLLLVPLEEPCSPDVTEDGLEELISMEIEKESGHTRDEQSSLQENVSERLSVDVPEESEDAQDHVEPRCWVDDATVSSARTIKSVAPDDEDNLVETVDAVDVITEDQTDEVEGRVSIRKKTFSDELHHKEVTEELTKASGKGKKANQQKKSISSVAPVEFVVSEHSIEPEPVQEPEPSPEPEPVVPGRICPSSVNKSVDAEIKIWLQSSSFSAANKVIPFTN